MEQRVLMSSLAVWNFNDTTFTVPNYFAVERSTAGGGSGINQPVTASGTSIEGFLTLSEDGLYLLVPGYDSPPGETSIANTASSAVNRDLAVISADGVANTTNTFANWTSTGSRRAVAGVDGTRLLPGRRGHRQPCGPHSEKHDQQSMDLLFGHGIADSNANA